MLLLSLACAAIAIAGPDCVGTGLFVRSRVGFFSFIFLLAWMASALQRPPKPLRHGIPAVFCRLRGGLHGHAGPGRRQVERHALAGVTDVGQHVRPNSTVLQLDFAPLEGIDPALHAVGLISDRRIINLRNYEALADHCPRGSGRTCRRFPRLARWRRFGACRRCSTSLATSARRVDESTIFCSTAGPAPLRRRLSRGRAVP